MPRTTSATPTAPGDSPAHTGSSTGTPPITDCVDRVMQRYFSLLNGERVSGVYQSVLDQVELPLLRRVLQHTEHNQSAAAQVLGISRATLRRKLQRHNLLS